MEMFTIRITGQDQMSRRADGRDAGKDRLQGEMVVA